MDCKRLSETRDGSGFHLTKEFLEECANHGGRIPEGAMVYRGDTRSFDELSADQVDDRGIKRSKKPGFVPGVHPDDTARVLELARQQAKEIAEIRAVGDFIFDWKGKRASSMYQELIFGYRGLMRGVSCGTECSQMGGHHYRIRLPELFVINVNKDKGKLIVIYGNAGNIDSSTVIWMNLINGANAEEMVSLTEIPIDWIEVI